MKTNYLKKYIISSYILVWILIIFVAGVASLVFHAPPIIMWIVRNLIAWSPTYLLLLGWKHFRPDETRIAFVKRCFSGKVKLLPLLLSFALTFGISVFVAVPLFCYDGQINAVLHQSGHHSIAAQYFPFPDFWTDRGRIGMAWFYAGGI